MKLGKYVAIGKTEFRDLWTHTSNQIVFGFIIGIILFVFMHIWQSLYAGKTLIEGYTFAQMIWYLAIAETIMFSGGMHFVKEIGEEVRSGQIGNYLLKPMNYLGYTFSKAIINFIYTFVVLGVIASVLAYLFVGPIQISMMSIIALILAAFIGFVINFFMIICIGLATFWMEDSSSLYWLYQKGVFILGGMIVPLEVYPAWIQGVVNNLPFGFMIYSPVKLLINFDYTLLLNVLLHQVFWILIAFVVAYFIFRFGIRKVNINGG